jgi:Family of unknown function (DUF6476)
MKALKLIVIVMGVMLVAGIVVIVATIAMRLGHRAAPVEVTAVMAPNGEHRLVELPASAQVVSVQSEGDRITVRLKLPDESEELILLDWKTGARLGTIDLKPAPIPTPAPAKP